MRAAVAASLLSVASAQAAGWPPPWSYYAQPAPKVEVLFLTEAGCPPCQRGVVGAMNDLVRAPGLAEIIDMKQHPFGNNYFATRECGGEPYNTDVRHCWAAMCVTTATPAAGCFTGDLVTQHGPAEGMVNRMQACAKAHAPTWQAYWPFLVCMEREYEAQALGAAPQCATEAQLDYGALEACYMGAEGDRLVVQEARDTMDHEGTPTVKVNGKEVLVEQALAEVCAAYTGQKPSGCCGAPAVQV